MVEEVIYQTLKVGKSLEGPEKMNVEATVRAEEDDEDDEYGSWGWDD